MTQATVKLATNELKLLDRLDKMEIDAEAAGKAFARRDQRFAWRRGGLVVNIDQPGGNRSQARVAARNLSCEGMSFLTNRFIYVKSTITIIVPRSDGTTQALAGTITHCNFVEGAMHLAGLRFTKRIEPKDFLAPPRPVVAKPAPPQQPQVGGLSGRVLYLDDSEMDRRLAAHFLKGSGLLVSGVKTVEEAVEALATHRVDIFLTDLNLGGGKNSVELIKKLRADGCTIPIVVMTADAEGPKVQAARDAGADYSLLKPYQRDALMQLISTLLQKQPHGQTARIYSSLEKQSGMNELLVAYVDEVRRFTEQLATAQAAAEFETVREVCLTIKGSAGGYGFALVSQGAEDALRVLDTSMDVEAAQSELRRLRLLCDSMAVRS